MKRFLKIFLWVLTLTMLGGCTRNNGDIGDLFGSWRLERIYIDEKVDENYHGDIIWKFQSDLIGMSFVYEKEHFVDTHFGTWKMGEKHLILYFIYGDDQYAPGEGMYMPLRQTHLPSGRIILDILKFEGPDLWLGYMSESGVYYKYILRRWG